MSRAEKHERKTKRKSPFHEMVDRKDRAFVLFYATWCPFSLRFLPIFEEFSRNRPDECLKVIADEEPDLCEEFAIEYYPTVVMFEKGILRKRLDAEPGVGLNKERLGTFGRKL